MTNATSHRSSRRRSALRRVVRLLALAAVVLLLAACHNTSSTVRISSLKDPYFPEDYTARFDPCVFRITDTGDVHIAGRTHAASDTLAPGEHAQYLHLHMYWQPRPGTTFTSATSRNATFHYVVSAGDGVAAYAGTGFAYPKRLRDGRLRIDIESARLLPKQAEGTLEDFLGPARLKGRLHATENEGATVQIVREMELITGS